MQVVLPGGNDVSGESKSSVSTKHCIICGARNKKAFSTKQWRKKIDQARVCKICMEKPATAAANMHWLSPTLDLASRFGWHEESNRMLSKGIPIRFERADMEGNPQLRVRQQVRWYGDPPKKNPALPRMHAEGISRADASPARESASPQVLGMSTKENPPLCRGKRKQALAQRPIRYRRKLVC